MAAVTRPAEPATGNALSSEADTSTTTPTDQSSTVAEVDKIPIGMRPESKELFQIKDKDGKHQWVLEPPDDVVDAAETAETAKFAFLVRKKKSYDSRKKYDVDSIIVQSPLLKEVLGIVFKDYPGITTTLERLVFAAPFHPFVHRWLKVEELLDEKVTKDGVARQHLQLFRDVLFEELKHAIAAKIDLVKHGVITFEFLWTIFEPSCLVYSSDDGEERIYSLTSASVAWDQQRGREYLSLSVWSVDWDGEKFGRNRAHLSDYDFSGTNKITSLPTFPLDFHPQKDLLVDRLLARGKIFEKFAGYHYQGYKGVALGYGRCGMIKHSIDSRIIIDCAAHNRFLPNQAVSFGALGKPTDSSVPAHGLFTDSDEASEDDYGAEDETVSIDEGSLNLDSYTATPDTENSGANKHQHRPLTQKELLLAVPYVRGYALKTKRWLWFFVDQIVPIKFADNAFTSLVLPSEQKRLIRAFVESQAKYKDDFDDVIAGKGRGMIMLLAGPPGVGKTLTAESVAEIMHVPLYQMSAGDLGLDPADIEDALATAMDMVAKWNAVLLLDEADVFLEQRSTSDLERNKLVSIFLRVLEYYEGILFLTTNRIKDIDDAFHSRIHVTINYPQLSAESRRHIWQTFVPSNSSVSAEDLDKLSSVELNGRQIKNVLKTAQMLARSEGSGKEGLSGQLGLSHIQTVLAIERSAPWT